MCPIGRQARFESGQYPFSPALFNVKVMMACPAMAPERVNIMTIASFSRHFL